MQQDEQNEVEFEDFQPFVQPPQWILFSGITPHAFKLYCIMLAHVNLSDGKNIIWPSQASLAALMGLKKSDTIPGLLDQLYAIGAVTVRRIREGMVKKNKYIIKRTPPQGWNKPRILSEAYEVAKAKTPGQPVPPNQGVRTPKSGGSVPPNQGVKQEPLHQQQPQKIKNSPSSSSFTSEIASRPSDTDQTSTEIAIVERREDVERLCTLLADLIVANGKSKKPNISDRWRDAARLMLDRDGIPVAHVEGAIRWSQNHEFWRGVILSMPKLREKYDTLRLQAGRNRIANGSHLNANGLNGRPESTTDRKVREGLELAQKFRAMEMAGA